MRFQWSASEIRAKFTGMLTSPTIRATFEILYDLTVQHGWTTQAWRSGALCRKVMVMCFS